MRPRIGSAQVERAVGWRRRVRLAREALLRVRSGALPRCAARGRAEWGGRLFGTRRQRELNFPVELPWHSGGVLMASLSLETDDTLAML